MRRSKRWPDMSVLKVGLIVNPLAGVGGSVGLKGSDGVQVQTAALSRGGVPRGAARTATFLEALKPLADQLHIYAAQGLGLDLVDRSLFSVHSVGTVSGATSAQDTIAIAQALLAEQIDLLVFVGGDGTARDLLTVVGEQLLLGIPAGVKMHSGVFAVSPQAAAEVVGKIVRGELVSAITADVVDFTAEGKDGEIKTQRFGELTIPEAGGFLQHTKVGGKESFFPQTFLIRYIDYRRAMYCVYD